ncbi:MAG: carboxylating nicotinate-nucleotide diphosphorylase [Chloroflexaceae bacterium]|nr:carboxylating nicotinate-nucleotide diphosphorylase [Chloroflexaceae bacterium]
MNPFDIPHDLLAELVRRALREDIGDGDRTVMTLIPAQAHAHARIITREAAVIAGAPVAAAVFAAVDPTLTVQVLVAEGDHVAANTPLLTLSGNARSILMGERVALNLMQRMCGIATHTAAFVAAVAGLPARILDTRKTTPGLRVLEKYAVRMGGGMNHRFGLYDAIMIKDNHLALLRGQGLSLSAIVQQAQDRTSPFVVVEVEVESVEQALEAADAGADIILLDNMPPDQMREAVGLLGGRVPLEASGGITLATIRAVAESGVDYISVGGLTHSVRSIDLSLELEAVQGIT